MVMKQSFEELTYAANTNMGTAVTTVDIAFCDMLPFQDNSSQKICSDTCNVDYWLFVCSCSTFSWLHCC